MMVHHFDELYPGRFLKGTQLTAPRVIRILSLHVEELEGEDGRSMPKAVLRYRDADGESEIVWNKTNAHLAAAVLGTPDFTQWSGRLLTIWHDPDVRFGRERVGGIRVFGSPEMSEAEQRGELRRPRRKRPDVFVLRRTDKHGQVASASAAAGPDVDWQQAAIEDERTAARGDA